MLFEALPTATWFTPRSGETRLGQVLTWLPPVADIPAYNKALAHAWQQGQRIAIIGVPEGIGPRANLGRGGAEHGFHAALKSWLNLQANAHLATDQILMLGALACDDLQQQANQLEVTEPSQLAQLRQLCAELDSRLSAVLTPLFSQGFRVILIGGGHNNAYPLLQSLATAKASPVAAINLDPHADFRALEGRHSGNGFSYAHAAGVLQHYHVMGLHLAKNNAASLQALTAAGFSYSSIQAIYQQGWQPLWSAQLAQQAQGQLPLGIEVDIDAIQGAPASAINYLGVSAAQACQFVAQLAQLPHAAYLHLAEAAPSLHPAGQAVGDMVCGQLLSELMLAFIGVDLDASNHATAAGQTDS